MTTPEQARRALVELVSSSRRDVLATLVRWTGDLGLAEDALQDATVRALETWPRDGVPDNPVAWLRLTARRRAIDLLRRETARRPKEVTAMSGYLDDFEDAEEDVTASMVHDDLLRLVFTCCHPSLSPETQVALTLHTVCGLTNEEVARALLVTEAAMAKRLTRARQKIRQAHIPYRVPPDHELPDRWASVLATTYLLFNESYAATSGAAMVRPALADQAIRLGRLLVRLQPDDPGAVGLLALMLLQDSRRAMRTTDDGSAVLLGDQDRTRWDAAEIAEAIPLVGEGLRRSPGTPNRYVVQAAIAACHALAPSYAETAWDTIVSWYDVLTTVDSSPVIALNRAVAIAERDGPEVGLVLVEELPGLRHYPLWHATRAALLRRLERHEEAALCDAAAAALPLNDAQRRLLHPWTADPLRSP